MAQSLFDSVVIGGGVAGLTAGLFAARAGCSTLVLVPEIPGGQLATIERIEDFPGFPTGIAGYELGPAIQEQAAGAGAEFRPATTRGLTPSLGGWQVLTSDGDFETRTIIIAAGSRARELGVPGEQRFRGRGVSHCASCDGPLLRGKPAVVVGGGDSGLQEALALAAFAAEVTVVCRSEQPTAQDFYQQKVRASPAVRFRGGTEVEEILGDTTATGVRLRHLATGDRTVVEAAGVFIYVGLEPNTAFLQGTLRLDPDGRVPTDIWMRTELPGVFAAGDVRSDSASQAISAAGDGATAALAAHRYLVENCAR